MPRLKARVTAGPFHRTVEFDCPEGATAYDVELSASAAAHRDHTHAPAWIKNDGSPIPVDVEVLGPAETPPPPPPPPPVVAAVAPEPPFTPTDGHEHEHGVEG